MTDEERQLIQGLADRIRNAPAPQVDRDADNLIRQSIGGRPDALYILTQTVLIQEMALNQAKQQIEQLKAQPPQPAQPPASFLGDRPSGSQGGGFASSSYRTGYQAPPQQPPPLPPQYAPPQYASPQYVVVDQQPVGGRFSGFLQNAAQTAAGVVAGEVAFSAISSLFGHHGGGGFMGGGGYYSPGSETIINNYNESGDRGVGGGGNFSGGDRDLEAGGLSPDLEDRRFADDNAPADDAPADDLADDTSTDDSSSDDSSDDGSSYDDGSGSDDQ
jgi:hypothetical protein